jgi:hypothetical protein
MLWRHKIAPPADFSPKFQSKSLSSSQLIQIRTEIENMSNQTQSKVINALTVSHGATNARPANDVIIRRGLVRVQGPML